MKEIISIRPTKSSSPHSSSHMTIGSNSRSKKPSPAYLVETYSETREHWTNEVTEHHKERCDYSAAPRRPWWRRRGHNSECKWLFYELEWLNRSDPMRSRAVLSFWPLLHGWLAFLWRLELNSTVAILCRFVSRSLSRRFTPTQSAQVSWAPSARRRVVFFFWFLATCYSGTIIYYSVTNSLNIYLYFHYIYLHFHSMMSPVHDFEDEQWRTNPCRVLWSRKMDLERTLHLRLIITVECILLCIFCTLHTSLNFSTSNSYCWCYHMYVAQLITSFEHVFALGLHKNSTNKLYVMCAL